MYVCALFWKPLLEKFCHTRNIQVIHFPSWVSFSSFYAFLTHISSSLFSSSVLKIFYRSSHNHFCLEGCQRLLFPWPHYQIEHPNSLDRSQFDYFRHSDQVLSRNRPRPRFYPFLHQYQGFEL